MNCETLINIFNHCGGILHCDYNTKQCVIKETKLKCNISCENDSYALDRLLWDQSCYYGRITTNTKNQNKQILKIHRFHEVKSNSVTINIPKSDIPKSDC